MGKSNGSTRASASSSPRGLAGGQSGSLSSIRARMEAAKASGGDNWENRELIELYSQEVMAMQDKLRSLAGKNGWQTGFGGSIRKSLGDDNPIMDIGVDIRQGGPGRGNYYEARVGGARLGTDPKYVAEERALWNNDKRFTDAKSAVKWIESQARRINRKYKGKI